MDIIEIDNASRHRHPWEISKKESLLKIIGKNPPDYQFADLGAGDMYLTKALSNFSNKSVYAVDNNYTILRNENKNIIQSSGLDTIPKNSIDYIIAADVLEHIEDEDAFLRSVNDVLKINGTFLITVPAHQFLFSPHDVFLKHYRRYNSKQLIKLLEKHKFIIKNYFYFYTSLFFIRLLEVILIKAGFPVRQIKKVSRWKYPEKHAATIFVKKILNIDFFINRILEKLHVLLTGLSICIKCQKSGE